MIEHGTHVNPVKALGNKGLKFSGGTNKIQWLT
jgi:hypothetical protein